jgi:hypothetical protein
VRHYPQYLVALPGSRLKRLNERIDQNVNLELRQFQPHHIRVKARDIEHVFDKVIQVLTVTPDDIELLKLDAGEIVIAITAHDVGEGNHRG